MTIAARWRRVLLLLSQHKWYLAILLQKTRGKSYVHIRSAPGMHTTRACSRQNSSIYHRTRSDVRLNATDHRLSIYPAGSPLKVERTQLHARGGPYRATARPSMSAEDSRLPTLRTEPHIIVSSNSQLWQPMRNKRKQKSETGPSGQSHGDHRRAENARTGKEERGLFVHAKQTMTDGWFRFARATASSPRDSSWSIYIR